MRQADRSDLSDYGDRGYLIVRHALDRRLLDAVRAEATAICRGDRGAIAGVTPAADEDEAVVLRRYLCIHFPHKLSPLLLDVARLPAVVDRLTGVVGPNVKLVQSMLFIKSEKMPGQAWHQDESHIPTRDRSLTAVWIALDDATVDNGCLWVIPGSHRRGVLYPVQDTTDRHFDSTRHAYGFPYRDRHAVAVELPAGAAVVFDGHLLHRSLPNTSRGGMRRALVLHYMSAESLLPWFPPTGDETMATLDHRDVLLVTGVDPHAFKGITNVVRPYVRPL
jgi:ectoine hydroxylase-related dioxygenase (phytanoyl-CoA dioxygenase family)